MEKEERRGGSAFLGLKTKGHMNMQPQSILSPNP
jgi:hypothetical protein